MPGQLHHRHAVSRRPRPRIPLRPQSAAEVHHVAGDVTAWQVDEVEPIKQSPEPTRCLEERPPLGVDQPRWTLPPAALGPCDGTSTMCRPVFVGELTLTHPRESVRAE